MLITIGQFEISFGDQATWLNILLNPFVIGGVIGLIVLIVVVIWGLRRIRQGYATPLAFNKVVLLVQLPKKGIDPKTGNKPEFTLQQIQEGIGTMEAFFSAIAGLRAQRGLGNFLKGRSDHFSFELVANHDTINFYVAVDKKMQTYSEQHVQAQFPDAFIEEVRDYNIFHQQCNTAVAYLRLKREALYPLRTYKTLTTDPLNSITNILSKLEENDSAAIQIILRSAKSKWRKPGMKFVSLAKQGKKPKDALKEVRKGAFKKFFYKFGEFLKQTAKSSTRQANDPIKPEIDEKYILSPLEEEMLKAVEEKSRLLGMDVIVRVVVCAQTSVQSRMYLDNITNSFHQYSLPEYGNSFSIVIPKDKEEFIKNFIYRHFEEGTSSVLNTEEVSSIFHFPLPSLETPKISWLLSKKAPPPENLPEEGPLLGVNVYRGVSTDVRVKRADRRRHMYIIGTTGTGKTTTAVNLCIQDIKNGEGCCYIDPHGDTIENILKVIPKERADDVIVFDPSDTERPMGLNLLEFYNDEQKTFVINEMINIFDKLYDLSKTGGPRFEQYMRNAMLLIMADPASGSTLLEVPKVLSDASFRKYKLKKSQNMVVNDFWIKEAEKAGGEASLANMTTYITSKLTPFVSNDIMRPIIAQQDSTLNFREIMDNKKILLINLAKGRIGDINMQLLGMVIIARILLSALGRVDIEDEEKRADFYLYIDEFQNFITDSIGIILSEARKYRLNLVLANQFIAQLVRENDTRVRDAVFGNVGSYFCFRIGVNDLEVMGKQMAPVFSENDLLNCPAFNCYTKLMVDNANPPAFNMRIIPYWETNKSDAQISEAIKQISRLKYGRDKKIVEAEILDRVRKTELLASAL